jgi:hypothetical protein
MAIRYNVPVSLLDSFPHEQVILRSRDVSELVESLGKITSEKLCFVQLLTPKLDTRPLLKLKAPVLIDLIVDDSADFALLYKHSEMFGTHPVRVTVTAAPGFTKTARLAISLGLPVKLEVTQPDRTVVDELLALLDHYLHHTTVTQPMEFFHSVLMGFYSKAPGNLWEIQEEEPSLFRYVTDAGDITISRRLPITIDPVQGDTFLTDLRAKLSREQAECGACEFFPCCAGYFKLPDPGYRCDSVRDLFTVIQDTASELLKDYEACLRAEGGSLT